MKTGNTADLSLDDILMDFKRHIGQIEYILQELKRRGAQQSAYEMTRSYPTVVETLDLEQMGHCPRCGAEFEIIRV